MADRCLLCGYYFLDNHKYVFCIGNGTVRKVRMQTGTVGGANSTNVFGIMRQTLVQEGVAGLYRGVSAPIVAVSPIYALSFWGYDIGQQIVRSFKSAGTEHVPLTLTEISIAGGISALPATAVMAPTERIKCLLQVQSHVGGKPQYSGMTDCAMKVYQEGGIRSLYKGTMLTLMRDVPGSIAWFGTYEIVKRYLVQMQGVEDTSQLSPLAVLVAGGFAGMACWGVCIPPDVLKSRFQTAPEGTYSGIVDVYRTLIREEGAGALFAGFRPAMVRRNEKEAQQIVKCNKVFFFFFINFFKIILYHFLAWRVSNNFFRVSSFSSFDSTLFNR